MRSTTRPTPGRLWTIDQVKNVEVDEFLKTFQICGVDPGRDEIIRVVDASNEYRTHHEKNTAKRTSKKYRTVVYRNRRRQHETKVKDTKCTLQAIFGMGNKNQYRPVQCAERIELMLPQIEPARCQSEVLQGAPILRFFPPPMKCSLTLNTDSGTFTSRSGGSDQRHS